MRCSSKSNAFGSACSHLACFQAINEPAGDPAAAADNGTLWTRHNQIKQLPHLSCFMPDASNVMSLLAQPHRQHHKQKHRGAFNAWVAFASVLSIPRAWTCENLAAEWLLHHCSNHTGLPASPQKPCLGHLVLPQAVRNRVQWPPNSQQQGPKPQRAQWPLHKAFHLTSHHLLGFVGLHISIVLRHLLQPCLATGHLCSIKGVCVVLQDSQLEKGRKTKV